MGARAYMPERATHDLDIIIDAADAERAGRALRPAGFRRLGPLPIPWETWAGPDGLSLDVLFAEEPWMLRGVRAGRERRDPQGLPVVPMEVLVLMKLRASRIPDLADVTRMLGAADETQLEAVRALAREQMPEMIEDLDALVRLGMLEYAPP